MGAPRGPLGPPRGPRGPKSNARGANKFENLPNIDILAFWGPRMSEKNWIRALGPPRRDPGQNSASDTGLHVPNGGMVIHLVAKMAHFGSKLCLLTYAI